MKKTNIIAASLILAAAWSCNLFDNNDPETWSGLPYLQGDGAFIINEGNYLGGNGSVSFFSTDSLKIYNNLFESVNERPLGDIPNSMTFLGENAFIVVNNSGKIEIVNWHDMKSIDVITDLNSPRNMLVINENKAYVSSLYSKDISIINLKANSVSGKIILHRSSEAMVLSGKKAYVSCWASGNKVMVINTESDLVTDSITVGQEPESMVLDRNRRLWVLCTGGYSGLYFPELLAINTSDNQIVRRFTFPSKNLYPSSLSINGTGDTLYYIGGSVWKMGISDASLPVKPFVQAKGRLFYKIGIHPKTSHLYATNAVDYKQRGYLLRFNTEGTVIDSARADIIPGTICFKTVTFNFIVK